MKLYVTSELEEYRWVIGEYPTLEAAAVAAREEDAKSSVAFEAFEAGLAANTEPIWPEKVLGSYDDLALRDDTTGRFWYWDNSGDEAHWDEVKKEGSYAGVNTRFQAALANYGAGHANHVQYAEELVSAAISFDELYPAIPSRLDTAADLILDGVIRTINAAFTRVGMDEKTALANTFRIVRNAEEEYVAHGSYYHEDPNNNNTTECPGDLEIPAGL